MDRLSFPLCSRTTTFPLLSRHRARRIDAVTMPEAYLLVPRTREPPVVLSLPSKDLFCEPSFSHLAEELQAGPATLPSESRSHTNTTAIAAECAPLPKGESIKSAGLVIAITMNMRNHAKNDVKRWRFQ